MNTAVLQDTGREGGSSGWLAPYGRVAVLVTEIFLIYKTGLALTSPPYTARAQTCAVSTQCWAGRISAITGTASGDPSLGDVLLDLGDEGLDRDAATGLFASLGDWLPGAVAGEEADAAAGAAADSITGDLSPAILTDDLSSVSSVESRRKIQTYVWPFPDSRSAGGFN